MASDKWIAAFSLLSALPVLLAIIAAPPTIIQHALFANSTTNFTRCEAEVRTGMHNLEGVVDANNTLLICRYSLEDAIRLDLIKGLRYEQCKIVCGTDFSPYSWEEISAYIPGWLLPWLTLATQLPMQTSNKGQDLRSLLLCIGSPILA